MQSIFLIVLYVLIIGYNVSALPSVSLNSFYHQSVKRTINVKSHIEEQRVLVKALNGGVSEEWNYLVAIHPSKESHLSIVKASIDDKELGVDAVTVNNNEGTFFAVRLPSPIAAGSSVSLMVILVFTHTLEALPAEIAQSDSQYVVYGDNLYFYSPYYSDKERSTVKLYSSKIESHTKKSATVKSSEIEYGPFEKSAAFSYEELSVHCENNSPFVTFSSAIKEVEVSHWGNVAFEESIQLMHTGAKLKGSFSRIDYQKSPTAAPSSYRSISANLPVGATDIYYRDRIGNVSTSHVRQSKSGVFVEVLPRFPMFGGWKSDFQIGYNVPAHYFLFIDKNDSSRYVLNITFATEFEQAAVDEMEVRIVLPEGAYDIDWQTPFDIDSANFGVKVTYLDTTGRPVLVLKKRNVTKFHQQHFQVAYRFGSLSLLHEPFLLVLAFFLFFVASMAYVRLELSIVPSTPTTSLTSRRSGKLGYFINNIINTSVATIIPLVQSKRVSDIDAVIANLNESFEGIQQDPDLVDIAKEVKGLLSRLSIDADRYATNDDGGSRERLAVRMEEIEKVLTALASK